LGQNGDNGELDELDARDGDLIAHLLDALEPEERAAVEARLLAEPAAASDARHWSETFARFAEEASTLTTPAETTRARVLAAVRRDLAGEPAEPITAPTPIEPAGTPAGEADGVGPRPRLLSFLAMAAAVAALMLGVAALWRQSIAEQRLESMRAEREQLLQLLAETRSRVDLLGEAVQRVDTAVRTMSFPALQSVVLAGLETAPQASGVSHVRPDQQSAVFQAFGLPQLPPQRTYQLWYIRAGSPVSAGTFEVDLAGDASVEVGGLPPTAEIDAWAVTVEPAGGVPSPTGEMVLRG
jgi:anti-sigma-K factor RskA